MRSKSGLWLQKMLETEHITLSKVSTEINLIVLLETNYNSDDKNKQVIPQDIVHNNSD